MAQTAHENQCFLSNHISPLCYKAAACNFSTEKLLLHFLDTTYDAFPNEEECLMRENDFCHRRCGSAPSSQMLVTAPSSRESCACYLLSPPPSRASAFQGQLHVHFDFFIHPLRSGSQSSTSGRPGFSRGATTHAKAARATCPRSPRGRGGTSHADPLQGATGGSHRL